MALKAVQRSLLHLASTDSTAARCQLVNVALRVCESAEIVKGHELEDVDRAMLVKRVAAYTLKVGNIKPCRVDLLYLTD